jgi:hypothetical protein
MALWVDDIVHHVPGRSPLAGGKIAGTWSHDYDLYALDELWSLCDR